jgi:hypothetical protein
MQDFFFQATSNLLRQELGGGEREGGILCKLIMYFGFLIINLVSENSQILGGSLCEDWV